ncbi:MAG: initiation control protein YabA [Planctomycetaceae bacterium]
MDGFERELDREELLALVRELRAEVLLLRAEVQSLREENETLLEENRQLREENEGLRANHAQAERPTQRKEKADSTGLHWYLHIS